MVNGPNTEALDLQRRIQQFLGGPLSKSMFWLVQLCYFFKVKPLSLKISICSSALAFRNSLHIYIMYVQALKEECLQVVVFTFFASSIFRGQIGTFPIPRRPEVFNSLRQILTLLNKVPGYCRGFFQHFGKNSIYQKSKKLDFSKKLDLKFAKNSIFQEMQTNLVVISCQNIRIFT